MAVKRPSPKERTFRPEVGRIFGSHPTSMKAALAAFATHDEHALRRALRQKRSQMSPLHARSQP
jgi:hypothetical protein